jgi:spermidine synthase
MYIEKELKFDAIIYDLTMHPEAFARVKRSQFLDNLFKRIKERLNKNGIVTYQVGSEFDNSTLKLVKKLTSKYFESQKYNTVFIPSFAENWIFGSARPK